MKYSKIYLLVFLLILTTAWKSARPDDPSRKLERAKLKAERSYYSLSYAKSIKRYKKVLALKPNETEATLRIADSYRRVNDLENASKWYQEADKEGVLTDKEDQLNYAQVLSSLGEYEEADKWFLLHGESGKMSELVKNRRMAIDNIETYYKDSMAYFVDITEFNSEQSDFGPAYMENGVVFASARPSKGLFKPKYSWDNSNFLDMFYVEKGGKPEKIQRGLNTRYHEGPASFFQNDEKVIFTRNNYHKGKSGESKDGINKLKLFFSEKSENGKKWCPPTELPFNSDDYSVGHPTVTSDGRTIYFASDMPGGYGGSDIYMSELQGEKWSTPQNMGDVINTPGNEFFPFVHNDETLFYSSDGMPGIGGLDVFEVAVKNPGTPKNIGYPVNTTKDDFGLILSSDGRSGYLSSNRETGEGHDDIYYFEKYFYDVKVILVHAETGELLEGKISSIIKGTENVISATESGSEITFRVLRGYDLDLNGSKEGFEGKVDILKTTDLPKEMTETYVVKLPLMPMEEEEVELVKDIILVKNNGVNTQVFTLNDQPEEFDGDLETLKKKLSSEDIKIGKVYEYRNIYYDFDKYNIREDAAKELDNVLGLLKEYPEMQIELRSHTDIRGTNQYNDVLADNRAKSARSYLIENGVEKDRISIKSYGEKSLYYDCAGNCDEVKHQSNRRTEIKIISEK